MDNKRIVIASDHAGFDMRHEISSYLQTLGYTVNDLGTFTSESSDYPDFAHQLAIEVETGNYKCGISLCGSGNGINIAANKHSGIRSAICWNEEISKLARMHNDANICALPARFISLDLAKSIVDIFLTTEFEGGRHLRRINKIPIQQ